MPQLETLNVNKTPSSRLKGFKCPPTLSTLENLESERKKQLLPGGRWARCSPISRLKEKFHSDHKVFFLILFIADKFQFYFRILLFVTFAIPPSWPILAIVCPLNGSFVALKDNKDQDL